MLNQISNYKAFRDMILSSSDITMTYFRNKVLPMKNLTTLVIYNIHSDQLDYLMKAVQN